MQKHGFIARAEIESEFDFIVYGPTLGVVAECATLTQAERALREKLSEANQWNMTSDLSIFRWSEGSWVPVVDLYQIQGWQLNRDPCRARRFV